MLSVKCFIRNLILMSVALSVSPDEPKEKKIEELEKEKYDLVKQIHSAIDDSVNLLQKDNTTQNMQGVRYMLDLKQQIPNGNNTFKARKKLANENTSSEMENRRMLGDSLLYFTNRYTRNPRRSTLDRSFNIEKVLYGKKYSVEKMKKLMMSRIEMQKKLDEWILERELEKEKTRERYKANKKLLLMGLLEKCPRHGTKNRNFRRRLRNRDDDFPGRLEYRDAGFSGADTDSKRYGRRRRRKTYPCCRKCCKKSYLGCL